MATRVERALEAGFRIRPGEARRVALMAAYAANAIGAVVVGRSVRDALYLAKIEQRGGAAHGLAGMYVFTSLAIIAVSFVYGRVADKAPRGLLNASAALVCAGFCAAFWALCKLEDRLWVYAALYIFVEAMGSLVVIQFWTLANEVFHAREGKRLFGLVGGGGTLANVVFGLLVGRYARVVGATNLLWLMVLQLCACAVLARAGARLVSAAPLPARRRSRHGGAALLSRTGLSFLANRHLAVVACIGAVSAAAVTIVDYQFKLQAAEVLHAQFHNAKAYDNALAGYFGSFYALCGGIALVIQIWITGRVLERFGILASLLPLPVGIALGSGAAAVASNPGLYVSSLAKGADSIFRYTITDASMQLLYVPVPPQARGRAKAFIDGILKPTAIALTGSLLLFYRQAGGEGRALTAAVLGLVLLWIAFLVKARSEYVKSLVESLERRRLDLSAATFSGVNEATLKALKAALASDAATALHALSLVQQLARAADFSPQLRALLSHPDPRLRAAAVQLLGELQNQEAHVEMRALLSDPLPEVRAAALGAVCAVEQQAAVPAVLPFLDARNAPEAVVRAAAAVALIRHAGLEGVLAAAEPLKELLAAPDPLDRAAAADALGSIGVRGFYRPLLSFLRDPDPLVRRHAISAAGKLQATELIPALFEQFLRRDVALEAVAALAAFGPGIEPELLRVLRDESARSEVRRGSALVLQRLGTGPAAEALAAALDATEAGVRKVAARGLLRLVRKRRELGTDPAIAGPVSAAVRRELAAARRALAALKRLSLAAPPAGLPPRTPAELLHGALLEERDGGVLQALSLLEVLLPEVRLEVIAENLRSGSAAQRGNAIEILAHALPEPWNHLSLAALDEGNRAGDAVAADPRGETELLAALLRGEASPWVAACAARWSLDATPLLEAERWLAPIVPALQEALLSPHAPLREAAAIALAAAAPASAPGWLAPLARDRAPAVSRTVRAILGRA